MPRVNKKIVASGIMDILRDPIGTIKETFQSIPTKLNNISTRTLDQYGGLPIQAIWIARTPLNNLLTGALNTITNGKFIELQRKYGYDKLFHLALLIQLPNGRVIVEKNEVINIAPSKKSDFNNKTEYFAVPLFYKQLNLRGMIENTYKLMGNDKFYSYSALGGNGQQNNCQDFVRAILSSNGLLSQQANQFIYQDMTNIVKDLENNNLGFVPKLLDHITDLGSKVSRLIGANKYNSIAQQRFIKFVKNKGLRMI